MSDIDKWCEGTKSNIWFSSDTIYMLQISVKDMTMEMTPTQYSKTILPILIHTCQHTDHCPVGTFLRYEINLQWLKNMHNMHFRFWNGLPWWMIATIWQTPHCLILIARRGPSVKYGGKIKWILGFHAGRCSFYQDWKWLQIHRCDEQHASGNIKHIKIIKNIFIVYLGLWIPVSIWWCKLHCGWA